MQEAHISINTEDPDELATIVKEIEGIVEQIREVGITTIIVEQNALAVLKYSDRAVILDTGVVVYDGPAKEVLENEDLRNRYLAI